MNRNPQIEINAAGRQHISDLLNEHYGNDDLMHRVCGCIADEVRMRSTAIYFIRPTADKESLTIALKPEHYGPGLDPVWPICVDGLEHSAMSVRAPSKDEALQMARAAMPDRAASMTIAEPVWHADPCSAAQMLDLKANWVADPIYDLWLNWVQFPQHKGFFKVYQENMEKRREEVRQEREKREALALGERAAAAGVSPQVMKLMEKKDIEIGTLRRALMALVGGDSVIDPEACYRVLTNAE